MLQNRAGRIILGVDFNTSTRLIHSELCWQTKKQGLFYQTCILMCKNDGAPKWKVIEEASATLGPMPGINSKIKNLSNVFRNVFNLIDR